jgi:hypothetical protein
MTTPYGTSKFNDTPNPNDPTEPVTRSLTLSDPLGDTTFIYLYQYPSIIPASDPTNTGGETLWPVERFPESTPARRNARQGRKSKENREGGNHETDGRIR